MSFSEIAGPASGVTGFGPVFRDQGKKQQDAPVRVIRGAIQVSVWTRSLAAGGMFIAVT